MTIHYLVDVSWMLHRGYFALSHVYEEYPEIHFLCKKIESWLSRKDVILHLCLDGFNIKGRRLLGEQYKAGRHQDNHYNVYAGLSTFINLLNNDRIKVYYSNDYESDELIFTLSRTLDGRKRIISGDKDLLQSLKSDVVIEGSNGLITTYETYQYEYADKFFGIQPEKLPIFRAIVGDTSDNLKPPVIRFPKKLAVKIVNDLDYNGSCPSIDQLSKIDLNNYSDSEKKWLDKLISNYSLFNTNFEIMKLNVITDNISNKYKNDTVEFSDFLKNKISCLNNL